MPQQNDKNRQDIHSICHELRYLYNRIPMFATWKVPELESIGWRYMQILHDVIRIPPYDQLCRAQVHSLPEIMSRIHEAAISMHWSHFNRAAIALGWDIESLIAILCRHSGAD